MAGDIVFRVDDFPDEEMLAALGMQDPFELTGLYQGVDLSRRLIHEIGHHLGLTDDQIHLIESE